MKQKLQSWQLPRTTSADFERILDLDADLDAPLGARWFEVTKGDNSVIGSAPHATKMFRENAWRFSDSGTAALAEQLRALAHVNVIHTTFRGSGHRPNPNYYDDNDYKCALGALAKDTRGTRT